MKLTDAGQFWDNIFIFILIIGFCFLAWVLWINARKEGVDINGKN